MWVPWWLGHPPFRHCNTSTCTIRHCKDSPHKRFHFVTIWSHRGQTVRPTPNRSLRSLRSGSKCSLYNPIHGQSNPFFAPPGRGGDSSHHDTQMTLFKKRRCATRENCTHAWVSQAQAWPYLIPNMARPTQQSSTSAQVNGVFLGGVDHTPGLG
jgi:hypothetical protein